MRLNSWLALVCAAAFVATQPARADEAGDLKAKFEALEKQMEAVKAQLDQVTQQLAKQKEEQQKAAAAAPASGGGSAFLKKKEGDPVTFTTPGGEITLYGHFNVSLDDTPHPAESYPSASPRRDFLQTGAS